MTVEIIYYTKPTSFVLVDELYHDLKYSSYTNVGK